jgi:hypothetical protein
MIRKNKTFLFTVILSLLFILVFDQVALSQPPPPPPGGVPGSGGHDLNANQGAPLGEGIWILLTLAFSYGLHSYMRRREHVGDESLQDKLVSASPDNSGWETHESGLKAFINSRLRPLLTRLFSFSNHKD